MAIKCITNPLLILFRERNKSWLRLPAGLTGQPPIQLTQEIDVPRLHLCAGVWSMSKMRMSLGSDYTLGSTDVFPLTL